MRNLSLFLVFAFIIGESANWLHAQHYSRDELESGKIEDIFKGVPVVENYHHIQKCIVRLAKPDQNLAKQAKSHGVVICQALIDEDGMLQAVYLNQSLHPMLNRAVIDSLRASEFKSFREVAGRISRYSLLMYFPFYPSNIDRERLPELIAEDAAMAQEKAAGVPYDNPPEPVGGFQAIVRKLKYPAMARRMGIEGTVVIRFIVDDLGNVGEFEVVQPLGLGLVESSIEAIRAVKWRPAESQGEPVAAWISVPTVFKLR